MNNNPLSSEDNIPPQQKPALPYHNHPYQTGAGVPHNEVSPVNRSSNFIPSAPTPVDTSQTKLHIVSFTSAISSVVIYIIAIIVLFSSVNLDSPNTGASVIANIMNLLSFGLLITAIVTGHISLRRTAKPESKLAKAGLIIAYVSLVVYGMSFLGALLLTLFIWAFMGGRSTV